MHACTMKNMEKNFFFRLCLLSEKEEDLFIRMSTDGIGEFTKQESYSHTFPFSILKSMILGSFAGLGLMVINSCLQEKSAITNNYIGKLKIEINGERFAVEGMDEERDLCQWFYYLQENFSQYNPQAYSDALAKTSDLCFQSRRIECGTLNEFIPRIEKGELDPVYDINFDNIAHNLWYAVDKNLKLLIESVRDSEREEFEHREMIEKKYKSDYKKWEKDVELWKNEKLTYEMQKRTQDAQKLLGGSNSDEKSTSYKLRPQPIPPTEPDIIKQKLKSDIVELYAVNIDKRNMDIMIYIKKSIEKFRKDHPAPSARKDLYADT